MRKSAKKILALCTAVALIAGTASTAFAADTKTYELKKNDGTVFGSISVTGVLADTVSDGIKDGGERYTIQITKDSSITYDLEIEGVQLRDEQGKIVFDKESTIKVSNAKILPKSAEYSEEPPQYEKGYTIQFINTGKYSVGLNGSIGGSLGIGFYPVIFEVTDGITNPTAQTKTPATGKITATPTSSKVLVNGSSVAFDAYTISGNNYFKLRDVAKVVSGSDKQFEVSWDGTKNAINLISNKAYTATGGELAKGNGTAKNAIDCTSAILKDGNSVTLKAYTIDGNNYFKLRDLGQSFNFDVSWDGKANSITIDTSNGYTVD